MIPTFKNNSVSKFFDNYATDFDEIYGSKHTLLNKFINHYFRASMRIRFEKTIEGCYPIDGMTVIDIGCGSGHYVINLALRGAEQIVGLDFSQEMLNLATWRARQKKVSQTCSFINADFSDYADKAKFDYSIIMGFMDYVEDPSWVISKVIAVTSQKAFFSFPLRGGVLAWQRKIRYSRKCPLHLYSFQEVQDLFHEKNVSIEQIARDLFVTLKV